MLIDVFAPSYARPNEAKRLMDCLLAQSMLDVVIVPDIQIEESPRPLTQIYNERIARGLSDWSSGILILADHLTLEPGFLEELVTEVNENGTGFQYGLNICNMPPNPGVMEYSFTFFGREFIEGFKGKDLFCPDYYHFFADTELGEFSSSLGIFRYLPNARIKTYHPNAGNAPRDLTNLASRQKYQKEVSIRKLRKELGFLWGKTYERVAEYGELLDCYKGRC